MATEDEKFALVVILRHELLKMMRAHYKRGGAPANGEPVTPKNEWPFIHSGNVLGRVFNTSPAVRSLGFFAQFDDAEQLALMERALGTLQREGLIYVTEFVEDGSVYDDIQKKHFPAKIPRRRYELTSPLHAIARAVTDEKPPIDLTGDFV